MVNPSSRWAPDRYSTDGAFVPKLGRAVLELLDPQPGERILDLGCGDGVLTAEIAARGAAVVGFDASPELAARARDRGLDVVVGDGELLDFDADFDAVFSNAALHWMLDGQAVCDGVFRALRPGGRFVAELGGFGNIAAVLTAIDAALAANGVPVSDAGQFYPTVDQYEEIARSAGFDQFRGELIPRPTYLPGGMEGWIRTFRQGHLEQLSLDEAAQNTVISAAVELLGPRLCDWQGNWYADYVRLRFVAQRS